MNAGAEAAGSDPVARYRPLGRSYVRFAREQPSYFRAPNHPEVRAVADAALRDARRAWYTTLREVPEAARAAGWHPESDPDALVAFSIAAAKVSAPLGMGNLPFGLAVGVRRGLIVRARGSWV
jgi:hypothetical protein